MTIDIQYFKNLLETEKIKLESELGTVAHKNLRTPGDWEAVNDLEDGDRADEGEVALGIETLENNTAIVAQLETRLAEVVLALDTIEHGTYGICTVCDEPIEEDRLEANPAAATCKLHME